jgi:hypothetical protein
MSDDTATAVATDTPETQTAETVSGIEGQATVKLDTTDEAAAHRNASIAISAKNIVDSVIAISASASTGTAADDGDDDDDDGGGGGGGGDDDDDDDDDDDENEPLWNGEHVVRI